MIPNFAPDQGCIRSERIQREGDRKGLPNSQTAVGAPHDHPFEAAIVQRQTQQSGWVLASQPAYQNHAHCFSSAICHWFFIPWPFPAVTRAVLPDPAPSPDASSPADKGF